VAWKHLRHPNILPLLGATLNEHRLCLISEWMDQGNISDYLKLKENQELNRIELVSYGLSRNKALIDLYDWFSWWKSLTG